MRWQSRVGECEDQYAAKTDLILTAGDANRQMDQNLTKLHPPSPPRCPPLVSAATAQTPARQLRPELAGRPPPVQSRVCEAQTLLSACS